MDKSFKIFVAEMNFSLTCNRDFCLETIRLTGCFAKNEIIRIASVSNRMLMDNRLTFV